MIELLHHDLTTATAAVTRPVQEQVIQHSNMNRAEVHKDPPLTEGLLAVDIFCGIDRQFSSEVWPPENVTAYLHWVGPTPMHISRV